jgi:hypothetical protein
MIRKTRERALEGNRQSAFRVRGRPVNPGKISRYMRDHHLQSNGVNMNSNMDCIMEPAGMIPFLAWLN